MNRASIRCGWASHSLFSRDLKKPGVKFAGSTIIHAFMQSIALRRA